MTNIVALQNMVDRDLVRIGEDDQLSTSGMGALEGFQRTRMDGDLIKGLLNLFWFNTHLSRLGVQQVHHLGPLYSLLHHFVKFRAKDRAQLTDDERVRVLVNQAPIEVENHQRPLAGLRLLSRNYGRNRGLSDGFNKWKSNIVKDVFRKQGNL
jgi:hypothetical protein